MTEENQEELSMEEILSSIRNILMEDNVNQEEKKPEAPAEIVNSVEERNSEEVDIEEEIQDLSLDDDILDLSSSMLVNDFEEAPINLEVELLDVDDSMPEVPFDDSEISVEDSINENNEEEIESILDNVDPNAEVFSEDIAAEEVVDEDTVIDEGLNSLEDSVISNLEEVTTALPSFTTVPEENILDEDVSEDVINLSIEDALGEPEDLDIDFTKHFEEVPSFSTEAENEVEGVELEAVLSEEGRSEIVDGDASKKLLKGFANVFSDNKKTSSIDDDIVAAKVQDWLSKNLPSMLEKMLNKEEVRVIEKTGK